ncbi:selenium-dependent molybdenum cofactor biosynthesis protein YqeB [Citrifermentans pelophilum]|uniref:selenium-dependent molybdenum cofactor biosynthesis protein YqeB n=1 Tax=Geoanaerobacter pelophilus TaxID=60036 RepID=UPI000A266E44|nr:selenium-dependent molybdenum cofactor biosynthesis protein YqeB [Geoanaerobacter pelophilus]
MAANSARDRRLVERVVVIRGAGEQASGIACRLYRANFRRILMLETASPLAVRRLVSFCEAVHDGEMTVEGITAVRAGRVEEVAAIWGAGSIAVLVDPEAASLPLVQPDLFLDATLAKRNLGTSIGDAPLVIGLGPGFTAGADCHQVIETNRGHDLGRVIDAGEAEADTGIPGAIGGYTRERVLRAPVAGRFESDRMIGDLVFAGEPVGRVGAVEVRGAIDGVLRGMIRPGAVVKAGLKIGDVDPRSRKDYCSTVSEKARALGGAVIEALLASYNS